MLMMSVERFTELPQPEGKTQCSFVARIGDPLPSKHLLFPLPWPIKSVVPRSQVARTAHLRHGYVIVTARALNGLFLALLASAWPSSAADLHIQSFSPQGAIQWENPFPVGIVSLASAPTPAGPWTYLFNQYTTNLQSTASVPVELNGRQYYRLYGVDVSAAAETGFENLAECYGVLETIAGTGRGRTDGVNYWSSDYEGGAATDAALSRPHFAMADAAGNIFIIDKDSHSLLKVTPDGVITTVVGTHKAGDGPNKLTRGTDVALRSPNGEWVRPDGTVYILDTGNGKVRKMNPDGFVTTLFTVGGGGINGGRSFWVQDDEKLVYFGDGLNIKQWTPKGGVSKVNSDPFVDPGNLLVDAQGNLLVTDRGAHQVYRMNPDGSRDVIAGTGSASRPLDGDLAMETGLYGVRAIWPVPNGGYLLGLHEGSKVVYVDPNGVVRILVDGATGSTHGGDGDWFLTPGYKIGEVRSVTMTPQGDILITENDAGYVRRIRFNRLQ